ncbi:MAG: NADH-quinone oxidoreductase subunit D [Planctomycetota bacterium]|jgi:NADH-quinone oxidoreductase subunit C/D
MAGEDKPVYRRLKGKFPDEILGVDDYRGDLAITVKGNRIVDICRLLKDDPDLDFKLFIDLCGVDRLKLPENEPRFLVVYHLYSVSKRHRVRLRVPIGEENAVLDSVTCVWKGAVWFEREVWDMFGIKFRNHPNLRRLLCHDQFEGHALRKDYPIKRRQDCTCPAELLVDRQTAIAESPDRMFINVGPAHPATHGALRFGMEIEGETIIDLETEIGYLHRCMEKLSETVTWNKVIPYTDRLAYISAGLNEVGYCMAVEKLWGVEVTRKCQLQRIIVSELSRIIDHSVVLAAALVDLGGLTNFWYYFQIREDIYEFLEAAYGGRMMINCCRIGGMYRDFPPDWENKINYSMRNMDSLLTDIHGIVTNNRIFIDRTRNIGCISGEEAMDWGWTGPCLRASGVDYDIRKDKPYYGYDQFEWQVPVGTNGDCYDRYIVRMEEMVQSKRIIEQVMEELKKHEDEFVNLDDRRICLPARDKIDAEHTDKEGNKVRVKDPMRNKPYDTIEDVITHFRLISEGMKPPAGEAYSYVEGASGEVGYYVISDGAGYPYRVHVRPPCYAIFQAFPDIMKGHMIPDIAAVLASINIEAGELDR